MKNVVFPVSILLITEVSQNLQVLHILNESQCAVTLKETGSRQHLAESHILGSIQCLNDWSS